MTTIRVTKILQLYYTRGRWVSAANPDEVAGAGASIRVSLSWQALHLIRQANLTARDMVALGFPLLLPARVTASFRVVPFVGAVSIRPE